jgi:toxin-antitoxin system PIN domain toxin
LILLDANILLYAYDGVSVHHERSKAWLNRLLAGDQSIGIPWISIWAFVRISTNPRLSKNFFRVREALEIIEELRESPLVVVINPGPRHQELLLQQLLEAQLAGPQTTDAALAALAIEYGATLASTDVGFRRFPSLSWVNPLA